MRMLNILRTDHSILSMIQYISNVLKYIEHNWGSSRANFLSKAGQNSNIFRRFLSKAGQNSNSQSGNHTPVQEHAYTSYASAPLL